MVNHKRTSLFMEIFKRKRTSLFHKLVKLGPKKFCNVGPCNEGVRSQSSLKIMVDKSLLSRNRSRKRNRSRNRSRRWSNRPPPSIKNISNIKADLEF
jgi:hypothetical protein